MHRQFEFLRERHQNAAARGAVELRHHEAGDPRRAMEGLDLRQRVLADGGVEHKQHGMRRSVVHLADHAHDLFELVHQLGLVLQAAGDTFRAAAIEQLKVWGERSKSPVIAGAQGSDSASLAFNALTAAKEQNIDVLLVDTAGRLQNKAELMNELEKVVRVIKKVDASAPHAVLLVLDATVGQNALSQVEAFHRTAGVTGLVMTKLDGTARGGILVALAEKFKLPVHFIGVGEGIDDLAPFTARDFANAIAGIEGA